MEIVWFLAGIASLVVFTVIVFAIAWQTARCWGIDDREKILDKREELLAGLSKERDKIHDDSKKVLDERWEKLKAAEDRFIKEREQERKKLEGFAKAVESRAQELGYIGKETWQDDDFNEEGWEDDGDPEPASE
jgi:hypothetical protein